MDNIGKRKDKKRVVWTYQQQPFYNICYKVIKPRSTLPKLYHYCDNKLVRKKVLEASNNQWDILKWVFRSCNQQDKYSNRETIWRQSADIMQAQEDKYIAKTLNVPTNQDILNRGIRYYGNIWMIGFFREKLRVKYSLRVLNKNLWIIWFL